VHAQLPNSMSITSSATLAYRGGAMRFFTGVRGIRILRTSPKRSSKKFSNHSEPGRRERYFAAPDFFGLYRFGVYF